ncbi:conjugal transfer protein TrbJ (plasmid) [Vibrio tubiashii ATCC 19109]|uniref:Conjugal transfer protein TrbJ n=1 Tax=Vibrio tubiashii ATCC 19109 TaxID=1051646 RepID=F9T6N5_9VIBR|nr:conjugal transfer protein TrbJ [Vibrio tubiashii ATCC 19109]EGU54440.1 conjugal transfer protein TrbJ [Vibrio tubiashii ATCC 19109]
MLLLTPVVNATGIPVVDGAALMQMVTDNIQRAAQWAKEADQWAKSNGLSVDQIKEYKAHADHYQRMVEGHYSFEDLVNDPILNNVAEMQGWRELYNTIEDIEELRARFNIDRGDDRFDDLIKKYELVDRFYKRTLKRNDSLQKLLEQFNTADTPAAKADLANAIAFEQTKIKNDQEMLASLQSIQEEQANIRHAAESRRKIDQLFGDGIPRK